MYTDPEFKSQMETSGSWYIITVPECLEKTLEAAKAVGVSKQNIILFEPMSDCKDMESHDHAGNFDEEPGEWAYPCVVLPGFNIETYLGCIQKYRGSFLPSVQPACLALLKHPHTNKYDLSSLQRIVSAAAPLAVEVEVMLKKKLGVLIGQAFGSAEASRYTHI
ncbi:hypothetical protein BZG36_04641 [Bifiguratus adelaidae]|uniref:AMP-dependent synthetase/ligase domain-containing protein n=1 Tax=Bifiguratus adelaidae TaxID=1938954 RepID=A0A261XXP9_9FUNG|nr:hypothetical protein BZG36_04641 [Bifiguratus adelaidae]